MGGLRAFVVASGGSRKAIIFRSQGSTNTRTNHEYKLALLRGSRYVNQMLAALDERPLSSNHRRFRELPLPSFADEVAKHLAETGEPETMSELYHLKISKHEPFQIITEVTVAVQKRDDGKLAPCPMCQPNKFQHGSLVFFPALEACAVIGHCCASRESLAAANEDYAQRKERRADMNNENYLFEVIPSVVDRLRLIDEAMPHATAALTFYRDFRSNATSVFNQLKIVKKYDNNLLVDEVLSGFGADGPRGLRTQGSSTDTRSISFGKMEGSTLALSDYNPVGQLATIKRYLTPFGFIGDDDALLSLVENMSLIDRKETGRLIRASSNDYRKFCLGITDFVKFFSANNFAKLAAWAKHANAPFAFQCRLTVQPSGRRQVIFDWWGGQFRREIPATLWTPLPLGQFASD